MSLYHVFLAYFLLPVWCKLFSLKLLQKFIFLLFLVPFTSLFLLNISKNFLSILVSLSFNFVFSRLPRRQKKEKRTCHQWSTRPIPHSRQSLELRIVLRDFEKWGRTDGRADGRTDMCESNDHYQQWLCVGRVDKKIRIRIWKCKGKLCSRNESE